MMSKRPFFTTIWIVFAVIGLGLLAVTVVVNPFEFHDHLVEPPLPIKDFALQTGNGEVFRLSDQKGKIVLLFFGYTHCPDVCSTTLVTFKQVYAGLGENAKTVKFVMITTDPDRDTPEAITAYVRNFNPEFIGLSGNLAELESIWKEFGVYTSKQALVKSDDYGFGHTASVYIIDQSENFIQTIPYGTSARDVIDELFRLLGNKEG